MNWQFAIPVWEHVDSISNEKIIFYIKLWRKHELSLCDWTQLPDVDLANKWDWAVYRQELRDLPAQGADPKLWVFPAAPA